MNLPNKLTMLRIILVPFFIAAFYLPQFFKGNISLNYLSAFMFFAAASLTDMLDGKIARSQGLVTEFGKFMDPLADKILVTAAFCVLVEKGFISAVPVIIIIAREFMVSGLRLVAAEGGVVVPAGIWGKLKTAVTMLTIAYVLLSISFNFLNYALTDVLVWFSAILTVLSGWDYLKAYYPYIDVDK